MLLLRLLGILALLSIVISTVAYLLTGRPGYWTFAIRTTQITLVMTLLVFALLALAQFFPV